MEARRAVLILKIDLGDTRKRLRNVEEELRKANINMIIQAIEQHIEKFSEISSKTNIKEFVKSIDIEDIKQAIELMEIEEE